MSAVRELPADLVVQLQRARSLERLAETLEQRQNAIYATTALLATARAAGWRVSELAGPVGLNANTTSKRIRDARRAGRDHPTGLVVDAPVTELAPLHEFTSPVNQREWLTRAEAAAYAGVAPRTVSGWSDRGLLPNTRIVGKRWRAYLRVDLDRRRR